LRGRATAVRASWRLQTVEIVGQYIRPYQAGRPILMQSTFSITPLQAKATQILGWWGIRGAAACGVLLTVGKLGLKLQHTVLCMQAERSFIRLPVRSLPVQLPTRYT